MLKFILLSISVATALPVSGQNTFYSALTGLSEIGYVIVASKNCKTKTIQDNFGCALQPFDNWYNKEVRNWESSTPDTIDYQKIKEIQSFSVKGTKELQSKTYGRAEIVKWTFITTAYAEAAGAILSKPDLRLREDLHKGPWTWWRYKENIYFIFTEGTYVKPDLDKIEKKVKERTNR